MLSLVLPTYNEAGNILPLIEEIKTVLHGMRFEIIVVDDDSPDRTWEIAGTLARGDMHVRVLRRVGRRGLSSAVVEGFAMANGDILIVMDADGQHDVEVALKLYQAIKDGAKIAVASRYTEGGSTGEWKGSRLKLSRAATAVARALPAVQVSDPMSGFFAVDAQAYHAVAPRLKPRGFKILLEILRYLPKGTKVAEVPLIFGMRRSGESKLSARVQMQAGAQLLGIAFQRFFTGRVAWSLFLLTLIATGLSLLPRAWTLRALYLDAQARSEAERLLKTVSEEQGWLLSDLFLQSISSESFTIARRVHGRGRDPVECYVIHRSSGSLQSCVP